MATPLRPFTQLSLSIMSHDSDFSLSTLSLNSNGSQNEDWDRSLILDSEPSSLSSSQTFTRPISTTTPRNSVIFPADHDATPGRSRADTLERSGSTSAQGKRSLSELLRLHAEKGTDVNFSQDEASRVADVLGQWVSYFPSTYISSFRVGHVS